MIPKSGNRFSDKIMRIRQALVEAGLLGKDAGRDAA
jgi:hypothetical protein